MSRTIKELEKIAGPSHVERLEVQLAGCLAAAEGWGEDCENGSYGWSPAFEAVLKLRKRYEELIKLYEEVMTRISKRKISKRKRGLGRR